MQRNPVRRRALALVAAVSLVAGCGATQAIGDAAKPGSATPSADVVAPPPGEDYKGREPLTGQAKFDPDFTHGMVKVDGGTIHYVRGGSGDPLILLHGWPQTWWVWRRVMPDLAKDHTVIAMDLPGLGDSSTPAGGYDKITTARRIREAVRRLGYRKVEIMTHDIGAQVGYRYARDFPGEVTRLAQIETSLPGYGLQDEYQYSWHYLFLNAPAPFAETIVDNDDVIPFYDFFYTGIAHYPEAVGKDVYFRYQADPAERKAGFEYYRTVKQDTEDNESGMPGKMIHIPLLAMGGEYLYGAKVGQVYSHVDDDVRTVIVPDAGHFVPEENPRFVIDCARLFFGPPGGRSSSPELDDCAPQGQVP